MGRGRTWTDLELKDAVKNSFSIRQVIYKLGLVPAGGNYQQITKAIKDLSIDNSHFTGIGWRKGKTVPKKPLYSLKQLLRKESYYNLHRLKQRLFRAGLKTGACEECGWATKSPDGRIPVELDHINGDRHDNRLQNLRILCPNCHSLKPTHRGRNKKRRGGETGRHATLKTL